MTSEPWNEFQLTQPPLIPVAIKNSNLPLAALRDTVENAVLFYESQKDLEESAAFCSRLLARRKNSFCNFTGYRELRKVNAALCRLLRLDIPEVLKNFLGVLPDFMKSTGLETMLPSQEIYDYTLLRIIAVQKLFIRITSCCKKSAAYFTKLLNKNFFIEIVTVILSTVSRIWKISRDNATRSASYYKNLIQYRRYFPLHRATLCDGFVFPKELEQHFTDDIDEVISMPLSNYSLPTQSQGINLEMDDTAPTSRHKTPAVITVSSTCRAESTKFKPTNESDLGVVISRDSLSPKTNLKDLKTLEHIMNFIKEENRKRKNCVSDCVTKNISEKTWNLLRKKLSKLPTNDNRSAIKLFRNILGNIS